MPSVQLGADRRLVSMVREIRCRCGYVVTDGVAGTVVLCAQKLGPVAQYINRLTDDKVSVASLYESPKYTRLVHRRWRVEKYPLEEVAAAFEQRRKEYPMAEAVVLCCWFTLAVAK